MPKRTKRTTSVDLSVDPPSESTRPDYPEPSWGRPDLSSHRGSPHMITARSMCADQIWHLPPFQRKIVWSAEQQVAYCNAVFQSLPTAMFLIWERHVDGRRVHVVLDGQQRLTALGAQVVRSDGTENEPTAARFDLASGRFGVGPFRWNQTATDLARFNFSHHIDTERQLEASADPDAIYWHHRIYAYSILSSAQVCHYLLPSHTPISDVIAAFRSINRPGVSFSEAEVERLVNDAADWSKES